MGEQAVTVSFEQIAQWSNELTTRIKCGEWEPDKWPPDMRALHRKICAATFLMHDLGSNATPNMSLTMREIGELSRHHS